MIDKNWRPDNQQSLIVDYVRAIGIVLVVMGHNPGDPFDFMKIYMYHMPLFFMIGGMLLNTRKSISRFYLGILKKYVIYIILMYITIGVIVKTISAFYRIETGGVFEGGVIKTILFAFQSNLHGNNYFLVAWFLFAYLIVSSLVFPLILMLNILIKHESTRCGLIFALAILFGYIGMDVTADLYQKTMLQWLNLLTQVLVGGSFYLLGYAIRRFVWGVLSLYGFISLFVIVYTLTTVGYGATLIMSWSQYSGGFLFCYIKAIAGIYAVFYIASLLSVQEYKLFRIVSKSSKSIMSLHLLVFLVLDIIFYHLGMYDINKTTVLLHYQSHYFYWLYVVLAILLPVAFDSFLKKAKSLVDLPIRSY